MLMVLSMIALMLLVAVAEESCGAGALGAGGDELGHTCLEARPGTAAEDDFFSMIASMPPAAAAHWARTPSRVLSPVGAVHGSEERHLQELSVTQALSALEEGLGGGAVGAGGDDLGQAGLETRKGAVLEDDGVKEVRSRDIINMSGTYGREVQLPALPDYIAGCVSQPGMYWFEQPDAAPGVGSLSGCRNWNPRRFCGDQVWGFLKDFAPDDPQLANYTARIHEFRVLRRSHVKISDDGLGRLFHEDIITRVCGLFDNPCRGIGDWPRPNTIELTDGKRYQLVLQTALERRIRGVNYGARFLYEQLFSNNLQKQDPGSDGQRQPVKALFGYDGADGRPMIEGAESRVDKYREVKDMQNIEHEATADLPGGSFGRTAMENFLRESIQGSHFVELREKGFNTVRVPLGWWNLVDLEELTLDGPQYYSADEQNPDKRVPVMPRWLNLTSWLKPAQYMQHLHRLFSYAQAEGMKVLLDFHGAPGGQSANGNCGTDLGKDSNVFYFRADEDSTHNTEIAIRALEKLADVCHFWGGIAGSCAGIELLNEPAYFWASGPRITSREKLWKNFYLPAMQRMRTRMGSMMGFDLRTPFIINDWTVHIDQFWTKEEVLSEIAAAQQRSSAQDPGIGIVGFSTHLYVFDEQKNVSEVCAKWYSELTDFERLSEVLEDGINIEDAGSYAFPFYITEYGLNAMDEAEFQGEFVKMINGVAVHNGPGAYVWNYDGPGGWGPVENSEALGISWEQAWAQ